MWKKVGCFALMLAGFVLSQVGDEMSRKQEKEDIKQEIIDELGTKEKE